MLKTVSSITNAIGALNYKGTWNASTNTPTIVSSVGVKGDYYVASVGGTTNINGISNWGVGDWITFNGSVWQRVEGGADLNGVNLSVSGTTTLSGLTASTALALDASKDVVSVTNTGTGDNVLGTSPTMTTPRVVTSINDTNGNELFGITATASAVNELTVANAATGNNPVISATGDDTNIGITITPKGTGSTAFSSGNVLIGATAPSGSFSGSVYTTLFSSTGVPVNEIGRSTNTNGDILGYLSFFNPNNVDTGPSTRKSVANCYVELVTATGNSSGNSGGTLNIVTKADAGNNNLNMQVASDRQVYFPGISTTASAANAFLNNASSPANQILRSTSSIRYKTDIEDLDVTRADAILKLRPVWYRSLADADRKNWSWYGLIAEEVAEIEPRLVHWSYPDSEYEDVEKEIELQRTVTDEKGNNITEVYTETVTEQKLKENAKLAPDGVQYERLTVMLLDVIKRQNERIETLEAKVAALEQK